MLTSDPRATVMAYHEAFHRNDRAAVRRLLADDGEFIGPLSAFTNPDAFLDAAAIFMQLSEKASVKQVITEGGDVCVLYDFSTIVPSIPPLPIASWFKVESGKIAFFHVHFDPTAFLKAAESGEVSKTLQSRQRS